MMVKRKGQVFNIKEKVGERNVVASDSVYKSVLEFSTLFRNFNIIKSVNSSL